MGSSSPDADQLFFSTTKGYKSHVLGSPAEPRRYVRGEGWGGGWGSIIQSLQCGPRLILIFEFEGLYILPSNFSILVSVFYRSFQSIDSGLFLILTDITVNIDYQSVALRR